MMYIVCVWEGGAGGRHSMTDWGVFSATLELFVVVCSGVAIVWSKWSCPPPLPESQGPLMKFTQIWGYFRDSVDSQEFVRPKPRLGAHSTPQTHNMISGGPTSKRRERREGDGEGRPSGSATPGKNFLATPLVVCIGIVALQSVLSAVVCGYRDSRGRRYRQCFKELSVWSGWIISSTRSVDQSSACTSIKNSQHSAKLLPK